MHHGDLLGFENIHIIDDSDDVLAVEYLRRSSSKYGISVDFTKAGMLQLEDKMTEVALDMRSRCDFIFKLDTDEFLGVHNGDGHPAQVDQPSFRAALSVLSSNAEKFKIPFSQLAGRQMTCGDPALATTFDGIRTDGPPKHFYNSKLLTKIDLGTHRGGTTTSSVIHTSRFLIMHFQLKCHEVYVRNLKEALISQQVLPGNATDSEHLAALVKIKNKFTKGCGMSNCHKASAYYQYLLNPEEVRRQHSDQAPAGVLSTGLQDRPVGVLFTGLRDRMQKLMLKYADF
jgi:hypothetical protein